MLHQSPKGSGCMPQCHSYTMTKQLLLFPAYLTLKWCISGAMRENVMRAASTGCNHQGHLGRHTFDLCLSFVMPMMMMVVVVTPRHACAVQVAPQCPEHIVLSDRACKHPCPNSSRCYFLYFWCFCCCFRKVGVRHGRGRLMVGV